VNEVEANSTAIPWLRKFDFGFLFLKPKRGSLFLKPKRKSQCLPTFPINDEFDEFDDDARRDDDGSHVDSTGESRDDIVESKSSSSSSSSDGTFGSEWTQLRPLSPRNVMLVQ